MAQVLYDVQPDLTCLGKIIGGGLPAAAYAGPKKIMDQISPVGPVYQAGTLSGNPLAMAAGLATLDILQQAGTYEQLEAAGAKLEAGLIDAASKHDVPLTVNRVGSMIGVYLPDAHGTAIDNFDAVVATDAERFATFFHALLEQKVMVPPSRFEAWFLGLAHDDETLDATVEAAEVAFAEVSRVHAD